MKLKEIARIVGTEFSGNDIDIVSINTLQNASSNEISFISSSKYIKDIKNTTAGAILVDEKNIKLVPSSCIAIVVQNPYCEVATLSKYFAPKIEDDSLPHAKIGEGSKISDKAEIANGATIGKNCTVLAGVYIGANSKIGDNVILYPNVVVYRDCTVGNNCIIHANTTIGGDGFGFATNKLGEHKKIYQNGNVVIEDDVEIGSSTTIDRAVFGTTYIKKGVRIDNLVQVGHNCEIGEYSVMVSQSGIAGSTKLGRNIVLGGQAAIAGHLEIAPFSTFAARSGITKSIKESGKTFAGFPLMEHRVWLRLQSKIAKLLK
ncbi:MAG: UDP-3-O-(3-hydroxymyristoyl)glucosamine N-acyltransferase [Sulfurimonas sp.]|nr:UDP-3-O-(3-hydroxymyristoyl)glucosamine N-acyltransferase [Sulfurimonas sp.]